MSEMRISMTTRDLSDWFGAQNVHLVPPQELPGELLHEPSRRFLTEVGLPRAGAFLELYAGRPIKAFRETAGYPVSGAERLLAIGESLGEYVALDGETGQVYLADPNRAGGIGLDLLAADLSTLVDHMREIETSSRVGDLPEVAGGPPAATLMIEMAERRLRSVDPEIFHPQGGAPHWSIALLIRSTRWAAVRGGDGDLAFVITPELVAELGEPHRYPELPATLTHEPTRRLLTEVGLPKSSEMVGFTTEALITLGEKYPALFEDQTGQEADLFGHQRDYLWIGALADDYSIALDTATGRLETMAENGENGPHGYLNQDLSALLYVCWIIERLQAEWQRWDYDPPVQWQAFDPVYLLKSQIDDLIENVDPPTYAHKSSAWRFFSEDPYTGGWQG